MTNTPGNESTDGGLSSGAPAQPAEFSELPRRRRAPGVSALKRISDVRFPVEAVLGRSTMNIGEIMELGAGSVVELDRTLSQPVELTVQGVTVARAEVVVVGDHFAVRIIEVLKPAR